MDNSFLKSLSPQQYSTYLTNTIYSFPDFAANISQGHAKNIHIESNDVDLIKRASFKDVTWASSFQDNESFDDYVTDSISYKAHEIADWILSDRQDFKNASDYFTKDFLVDFKDEEVGYGYKSGDLSRYSTSAIKIVLQRDMTGDSPFGFYLKTAYPQMNEPVKTNISFTEDYFEKLNEKEMSVPQKLFFYAQTIGIKGYVKNIDNEDTFIVNCPVDNNGKNGYISAFYTKDKVKYKLTNNEGKRRIDASDLYFECDKAKKFFAIDNKRNELVKGKSKNREVCTKNDLTK